MNTPINLVSVIPLKTEEPIWMSANRARKCRDVSKSSFLIIAVDAWSISVVANAFIKWALNSTAIPNAYIKNNPNKFYALKELKFLSIIELMPVNIESHTTTRFTRESALSSMPKITIEAIVESRIAAHVTAIQRARRICRPRRTALTEVTASRQRLRFQNAALEMCRYCS